MKKILITGENSFIGKAFIKYSKSDFQIDEVCLIKNSLNNIAFEKYDIVIHVAAIVHNSKKISKDDYIKINTTLPYKLAQKAKNTGVKQFVFLSSVKVYGENTNDGKVWNEFSECTPMDNYGYSKLEAEKLLKTLNDDAFTISIIRSSVVYGPGVKANILAFIKMIDKLPIIPFANINNNRALIFINNLVYIIEQTIIQGKSGVFLAIDGKNISTTELANVIITYLDKRKKNIRMPFRSLIKLFLPNTFNKLYGSIAITNHFSLQELDVTMPFSFREGIKETINWYNKEKNI